MALCAFLNIEPLALAQDFPVKVTVDGATYVVRGATVSGDTGNESLDAARIDKARFTARVLDQQILNSEFNKRLFSPEYRATVFSDRNSEKLIESWRRSLRADSPQALAKAKDQFKQWAAKLAGEPSQMMLDAVKNDYLDGIGPYRENAEIFRNVTTKSQTLTHSDALAFMRNAWPTVRLAYARGLEERLSGNKPSPDTDTRPAAADAERLSNSIREIVGPVDGDIKSGADLERIYANVAKITESSIAVQGYRESIRPPPVRFTPFAPAIGSARRAAAIPGSTTTTYSGQNTISITVPPPAVKAPPLADITGGILPSPYPLVRAAPAAANARPASPASNPAGSPATAGGTPGGPAGRPAPDQSTPADPSANNASSDPANAGSATAGNQSNISSASDSAGEYTNLDNLKTFSSKGYHRADGWAFNPLTGLWQNPNDASQSDNPTVLTCCDDTGLAFPSDAIEAQQDYAWNGGGVDPNCGRLYDCDPTGVPITSPAGPTAATDPTDKDDEILQALAYIDQNVPAEEKYSAFTDFMNALPRAYTGRGIGLYIRFRDKHRSGSSWSGAAPTRKYYAATYSARSPQTQSTITGIGGSGTSHYNPITQSAAKSIVGKYQSVPGGVTLEGSSPDLSFITSVAYVDKANAFILNSDVVYLNPVSRAEYVEIEKALAGDDKLGVSMREDRSTLAYGNLPAESKVASNLMLADYFLGGIAFGDHSSSRGYTFAPGYKGLITPLGWMGAAYFNMHDVGFEQNLGGHLVRRSYTLDTTLVPLVATRDKNGGFLPDFARIEQGNVPEQLVANMKHLQDNFSYYARERIVRITANYAEVATFVRSLKASGLRAIPDTKTGN
jgi:hypothetical protein